MQESIPKVVIIGVGGGGCNTVNRLARQGIRGAEMIAINTDQRHLDIISPNAKKILIGEAITKGLGAGGYSEIGKKSAELSKEKIRKSVEDANLIFLCAGMGGGTGTGAAPIVAQIAKEEGAVVISMVTYPFALERARLKNAEEGIVELSKHVDTNVVIDNNKLVELVPNLPIEKAFDVADEIVGRAVRGITETITTPSLINIDFADVKTITSGGGVSLIAVGEGRGINKINDAVKSTLEHPLLDVDYSGARGVLLHITGSTELTLGEANKIAELLTEKADPDANVIFGARANPEFKDQIETIAIFTGLKGKYKLGPKPKKIGHIDLDAI